MNEVRTTIATDNPDLSFVMAKWRKLVRPYEQIIHYSDVNAQRTSLPTQLCRRIFPLRAPQEVTCTARREGTLGPTVCQQYFCHWQVVIPQMALCQQAQSFILSTLTSAETTPIT